MQGPRQSPSWSLISSSSATFLARTARGDSVSSTMPSAARVEQARSSFGLAALSTTQSPQAP